LALRDVVEPLAKELQAKGEPFEQAVRRKRQEAGLPVRLATKVLPLRRRRRLEEVVAERNFVTEVERHMEIAGHSDIGSREKPPEPRRTEAGEATEDGEGGELRWQTWTRLRASSAELRMREAYHALEQLARN